MKSMLFSSIAAAAAVPGIALAALARAADASYLDALHRAGINWLPCMQSSEISAVPA